MATTTATTAKNMRVGTTLGCRGTFGGNIYSKYRSSVTGHQLTLQAHGVMARGSTWGFSFAQHTYRSDSGTAPGPTPTRSAYASHIYLRLSILSRRQNTNSNKPLPLPVNAPAVVTSLFSLPIYTSVRAEGLVARAFSVCVPRIHSTHQLRAWSFGCTSCHFRSMNILYASAA